MGWSGLDERSGFRARAGTLTLLMLAGEEEPEAARDKLAQLDAEMFDPGSPYDAEDWDAEEWDEEAEWNEEDEWDADLPARVRGGLRELHYAARALVAWLGDSPAGPLRLRDEEGMLAVGALATGWSSTVVHALSGAALTFEELEEATGAVSREALKARVEALEDACLVELLEGPGGEIRHAATPWLRRGIAPLGAAARHECRLKDPESAPPDTLDVGAAFLLALPLVELPADLSGACYVGAWMPPGGHSTPGAPDGMAGATVHVENGHVVSVDLELAPSPRSWVTGSPLGWLDTLIEPGADWIDVGGDAHLAEALVDGLHEQLLGRLDL